MADLWTSPINQLTFADVLSFCARRLPENVRLEYKATFSNKDRGRQIAKEVCAFANSYGGVLILGVPEDEEQERYPKTQPGGADLGSNPQDAIEQACSDHIFPPAAPEVSEYLRNPDSPQIGFVVVRVHASPDAPLAMDEKKGIYVRKRVNDKSMATRATVSEIGHMLERRRARLSLQDSRAFRGLDRLYRAVTGDSHRLTAGQTNRTPYYWVSIGPLLCDAPFIDISDLATAPPFPHWKPECVERVDHGVYCISIERREGFHVDVFGNLSVLLTKDELQETNTITRRGRGTFSWLGGTDDKYRTETIRIVKVLGPLLHLAQNSQQFCDRVNYFGMMRMRIRNELVSAPLVSEVRHESVAVVAANRTDLVLELAVDFATSSFGDEAWDMALRSARQLLWGCNASPQALLMVEEFLNRAEIEIHGENNCSVHHVKMPSNRTKCLLCRKLSEQV